MIGHKLLVTFRGHVASTNTNIKIKNLGKIIVIKNLENKHWICLKKINKKILVNIVELKWKVTMITELVKSLLVLDFAKNV